MKPLEAISTEPGERGIGRRALGDGEAQVDGASEMPSGSLSDETRGGSSLVTGAREQGTKRRDERRGVRRDARIVMREPVASRICESPRS